MEYDIKKAFGRRIRQLREDRGWTQEDLAKLLKVSTPTITEYETGKKISRPDKLDKLANIFKTTIDYLIGRTDEKEPIEEIKKDVQSNTPDILKILKEYKPNWDGKPITERQAKLLISLCETILKEDEDRAR